MYIKHSYKYEKEIKIIYPGEYCVSNENEIIGTLLGSCIAVCLIDTGSGVSGMNHFMLPGRVSSRDIFHDKAARYGIVAINHLLLDVISKGAKKNELISKIFGGGHVLETEQNTIAIPEDNIRIARAMMEIEDIPIIQSDVGDNYTRKLLMDVKSGKVYLKKTTRAEVFDAIKKRDSEFAQRSFRNGKNKGADN